MGRVSGEIGKKSVVRMMSEGRSSAGFVLSNCHFIFMMLDVGNSVTEVE